MLFQNTDLVDIGSELPPDHQRISVGTGYSGTADTIKVMQKVTSYGKRHWSVRSAACNAIQGCDQKDFLCYTKAIFQYVQGFRYVYDGSSTEYIQSPEKTIEIQAGDCDCLVCCLAAMLESIGIPCFFETFKKPGSGEFTHVAVVAVVPGHGKVPLDPTMPYEAGWKAPLKSKLWPATLDEHEYHQGESMNGLSGLSCESERMGALPIVCEGEMLTEPEGDHYEENTLSGLDCVECGGTCGQSLSGLGDTPAELSLGSVIDGSAYSELRDAKDESNQRTIDAGSLLTQARATGDANAIAAAQAAVQAAAQERTTLYQAINKYSELANAVQTYSLGVYKPQQLSGLGVAPAIIYALISVGAIYVLSLALSNIMGALRGSQENSKTLLQQATDAIQAAGGAAKDAGAGALNAASALKTVAIIAGVGLVAFLGYKLIRRGTTA
jgi:hypothetical protein